MKPNILKPVTTNKNTFNWYNKCKIVYYIFKNGNKEKAKEIFSFKFSEIERLQFCGLHLFCDTENRFFLDLVHYTQSKFTYDKKLKNNR